jgi:hypothetical protein
MKQLRYLAAGLMLITTVLHVIPVFKTTEDPNAWPMFAFGLGYLVIGIFLILNKKIGKISGIILPLTGLGIGFIKIGIDNWDTMLLVMFLIDAIVAISCIVLLLNKNKK